jgi:putative transposase
MEGREKVFYHVYNRGVDKRIVYNNDGDYLRFMSGMKSFNENKKVGREPDKFVDIISFCLMPNHFHFILSPVSENGITDFLRRLSTGYTMYFNKKYNRSGVLFESKYKAALIKDEVYLIHLSRYIHLNPLSLINPGWKEAGIHDFDSANDFLKKYRWSSYAEYLGIDDSAVMVDKSLISDILGGEKNYENFMKQWAVRADKDFDEICFE